MVSENLLTASFKLETDGSRIDQRMKMAIEKYKIDMVIGNVWGNKNWIKVKFNPKNVGEH